MNSGSLLSTIWNSQGWPGVVCMR